jgi:hypothetical protein
LLVEGLLSLTLWCFTSSRGPDVNLKDGLV